MDREGNRFPICDDIPRVCETSNYSESFGRQWNRFDRTQLDDDTNQMSAERFFATTGWSTQNLDGAQVLEVGSGAGRFSRVILKKTKAELYSVDYSDAVRANKRNNGNIAPDRFHLFQASIYELPFPDGSFDKVFCMGVLQHTPDFEQSVKSLVSKARAGGEIVVDFYEVRGWWTRLHAKYLLRPFTRRISHERLERVIEANVDWMMALSSGLRKMNLGVLTRFIPLVDMRNFRTLRLSPAELREWAVLDTFDMFSPEHDHPQTIPNVAKMFERAGAEVTFAGHVPIPGGSAAVVRAVRR